MAQETIEVNRAEYVLRGLGLIQSLEDIEAVTVAVSEDNIPVSIKDIAQVNLGPALRRGALDKNGSEVVGGVVVARYGANPLSTIQNIKARIKENFSWAPKQNRTRRQDIKINYCAIL